MERARRRSGRWGGAHAGAGASPARGGKRRRAGGDSCLMVPSSRLLQAALGCLPPADRLHVRLRPRHLACGAASEDSAAGELSETRGLGALEEISAETRVPVQPALWGSQKGQCITNDEVGEGFAQCWGGKFKAQGWSYLESPAGEDL